MVVPKSIYAENTHHWMERFFTISVLSENKVGLLHAITIIFGRRKINIVSINESASEVPDIGRFTIVVKTTRNTAEKVVKQIEKLVDVLAAFLYEEDQIHYREMALYKISKKIYKLNKEIDGIIKNHDAKIVPTEENYEYILVEKTGHQDEIMKLFEELDAFGVSEFVKSARISVSKSKRETTTLIKQLEESKCNVLEI